MSILFAATLPNAVAHKPQAKYENTPTSGDTYQTASGDTMIYTQIGNQIYACQIAPDEERSIIATPIYRDQRRTLHLDRLNWKERKQRSLSKRLFERYLDVLPIRIGTEAISIENPVVSDHTDGRGPCIGIGASSNYGGRRRTSCGFGLGAKILLKGSQRDWCVLGEDVLSQLPPSL
ncbi:MAG: hypothetical protein ABJG15_01850 [Hyphomonadaceae bacterium]